MIALAVSAMCLPTNTNAQDNGDREARRQEMMARQTERLMKDLKLTDEQKVEFEPIYQRYQAEMLAVRQDAADNENVDAKSLTDEQAVAQLQKQFDREAEQIQQMQLRLEIQKKYCAEMSAVLTPQQLVRVFQQQRGRGGRDWQQGNQFQGGRGPRGGGFGGPRGGFGGPGF